MKSQLIECTMCYSCDTSKHKDCADPFTKNKEFLTICPDGFDYCTVSVFVQS